MFKRVGGGGGDFGVGSKNKIKAEVRCRPSVSITGAVIVVAAAYDNDLLWQPFNYDIIPSVLLTETNCRPHMSFAPLVGSPVRALKLVYNG